MKMPAFALAAASAVALSLPALAAPPVYGDWGYVATAMDRSVKPGDDFWAYVNGSWDKATAVGPDQPSINWFTTLVKRDQTDLRQIIEGLAAGGGDSPVDRKIADTYGGYMDEAAIERAGTAPLQPYLASVDAVKTREQLLSLFVTPGYPSPISVNVLPSLDDPTRYAVWIGQGKLGLPDRDYYLVDDPKIAAVRPAYRNYIVTIETLAGLPGGEAAADRIIALETALAKAQWRSVDVRDPAKTDNPMTLAELQTLAPQVEWRAMLANAGLAAANQVVVGEPSAVSGAAQILASTPLSTWKEWLAFRFVSEHASLLPKAFDDAQFAFYSRDLTGTPQQQERWKRGVGLVDRTLGDGLGQIYVRSHYPPDAERQMSELVTNLDAAYRDRIAGNGWMDDQTRQQALLKLARIDARIGHPPKYTDYSSLKVVKGDVLGNAMRASDFQWNLKLSRFPHPVDRTVTGMTPQTVNAYFDPPSNQLVFPAGILQPPFFDPNADPASNYGAIGAIIGHEMAAAFDEKGRKFDADGHPRDWWTPATANAYAALASRLIDQFDGFAPYPGAHVDGKLTLAQNIGDLSGVETAYDAYRKYVATHGEPPVIDGFTGDQRFFIAYAQAWRSKESDDFARLQLRIDQHSPAKYRVNGIVRNVNAWYKAFNVQPGDALYLPPDQRVHFW